MLAITSPDIKRDAHVENVTDAGVRRHDEREPARHVPHRPGGLPGDERQRRRPHPHGHLGIRPCRRLRAVGLRGNQDGCRRPDPVHRMGGNAARHQGQCHRTGLRSTAACTPPWTPTAMPPSRAGRRNSKRRWRTRSSWGCTRRAGWPRWRWRLSTRAARSPPRCTPRRAATTVGSPSATPRASYSARNPPSRRGGAVRRDPRRRGGSERGRRRGAGVGSALVRSAAVTAAALIQDSTPTALSAARTSAPVRASSTTAPISGAR